DEEQGHGHERSDRKDVHRGSVADRAHARTPRAQFAWCVRSWCSRSRTGLCSTSSLRTCPMLDGASCSDQTHCLAGACRNGTAHQPDTTGPALISRCVRPADVIKVSLSVSAATPPLSARTAASRIVTVPAPGSSASGVMLTELNCDHQAR